jgi:Raf kinase inhibitor-like YbhB/YbcL family protein
VELTLLRNRLKITLCLVPVLLLTGCFPRHSRADKKAVRYKTPRSYKMNFVLESPGFKNGQAVPREHTCEGQDLSVPLKWSEPPKGTQSFVLFMEDPDAPVGTWIHWVVYDIPAEARSLEKGLAKKETLPNGAKQGLCWGVDSFDRVGYFGPCPPPGRAHRYMFKLIALDSRLNFPPRAKKGDLEIAMRRHILAEAVLVGISQR